MHSNHALAHKTLKFRLFNNIFLFFCGTKWRLPNVDGFSDFNRDKYAIKFNYSRLNVGMFY
jgi:hypothetical protein